VICKHRTVSPESDLLDSKMLTHQVNGSNFDPSACTMTFMSQVITKRRVVKSQA